MGHAPRLKKILPVVSAAVLMVAYVAYKAGAVDPGPVRHSAHRPVAALESTPAGLRPSQTGTAAARAEPDSVATLSQPVGQIPAVPSTRPTSTAAPESRLVIMGGSKSHRMFDSVAPAEVARDNADPSDDEDEPDDAPPERSVLMTSSKSGAIFSSPSPRPRRGTLGGRLVDLAPDAAEPQQQLPPLAGAPLHARTDVGRQRAAMPRNLLAAGIPAGPRGTIHFAPAGQTGDLAPPTPLVEAENENEILRAALAPLTFQYPGVAAPPAPRPATVLTLAADQAAPATSPPLSMIADGLKLAAVVHSPRRGGAPPAPVLSSNDSMRP